MLRTLLARLRREPELTVVATVLAGTQAVCPGLCLHCAVPAGGTVAGGAIVRVLRSWWRRFR